MKTARINGISVWLQNFYLYSEKERLIQALQTAGIDCREEADDSIKNALFILGESTYWKEVYDSLHRCTAQGIRVVCVGLFNRPLEHYKIWELLQHGAEEFVPWNQFSNPAAMVLARFERWNAVQQLLHSSRVKDKIIGSCKTWYKTIQQIVEAAHFSTAPVLLLGESGTGKELLARLIHDLDARPNKKDFIVSDCTTISPELSGSEFFGHEKGAFTNAVANRDGTFALADGGTLFLDEIGELPLQMQAALLRAVQEKTYKRVGSNFWRQTDFRLVSATNRPLTEEVRAGRFRADLFFRISACVCHVPPLRERADDIVELALFFLSKTLQPGKIPALDEPVLHYLRNRDYPGNVRDLQQLMMRIAYRHSGNGFVTVGDIPEADRPTVAAMQNPWDTPGFETAVRTALTNGMGLKEIKRCVSNKAMDIAISAQSGNLQSAAQSLQVSDRTIQLYYAAVKEGGVVPEVD